MIRAFFGLTQNPFDPRDLELLPQQQEIHDTLKGHPGQRDSAHRPTDGSLSP